MSTAAHQALVARIAAAMASATIRDDEGVFPSLFDLLGFSGENKARTVVRALAEVAVAELEREITHLSDALKKIASEKPGDTGVDCGRPGDDCHRCEDMIETAQRALAPAPAPQNLRSSPHAP